MDYLRNIWYVAGTDEEVGDKPLARTILEEPIVLYRIQGGDVVAAQLNCPHRFAPLDQGKVIGDDIQCPYHGLRFSPTGQCVSMPLGDDAPKRANLKVYPIVERDHLIWIWMGDPSLANADVIPNMSHLVEPGFGWFNAYIHVNANYQLLVDNLLDLSHAEFLHPLLASDGWASRNRSKIRQDGDHIRIENHLENDNILPIMAHMRPDMEKVGTSIWQENWLPPSLVGLSIQYYAAGEKLVIPSGHFLTPETETTTHYIFRGGHDVGADDPEYTAQMKAGIVHVFETEDVPMLEAQQRYLGDADLIQREPAILRADAAAIRARRHLAKLIKRENAPAR